jgi:outer membrane protein TolC
MRALLIINMVLGAAAHAQQPVPDKNGMEAAAVPAAVVAQVSAPLRSLDIEKALENLTLDNYVGLVLTQSLDMQNARASLRSAELRRDASFSSLVLPRLTADTGASKNYSDSDDGTAAAGINATDARVGVSQPFITGTQLTASSQYLFSETRSAGGPRTSLTRDVPRFRSALTQPLFIFKKNPARRTKSRAQLAWEQAEDSFRATELQVWASARNLYYEAMLNGERERVERNKLTSSKAVYRVTKALVDAGKVARVQLSRAKIRRERDFRNVRTVRNNKQKALNSLKDFILLPAEQSVSLKTGLKYEPFDHTLARLKELAERYNPALHSSKVDVDLARISLRETREGTFPGLDLNAGYNVDRNRADAASPRNPYSWDAGIRLTWEFYDARQTKLGAEQSRLSLKNLERTVEKTRRALLVAVENRVLDIRRIEKQILGFGAQRQLARSNIEATRLQYKNGITRLVDVFDAENEARAIELEYFNLVVGYKRSYDQLVTLVGRDLAEVNP